MLSEQLPSGVASTFISPDGERTFGTYLGAAASLKAEDLTLDMFKGYAYLFIEGYLVQDHEMILHAIELAKEAGGSASTWQVIISLPTTLISSPY